MKKMEKAHIEELLSCYLDDELSDRGRTEIKRLIQHDKEIADTLEQLRKQKKLLNALPAVSAPPGLLDDITASVERKLILGESPQAFSENKGARHLLFRRLATAAAMLVLVGALFFVVLQIITPGSTPARRSAAVVPPATKVPLAPTIRRGVAATVAPPAAGNPSWSPFKASLELKTKKTIVVNSLVEKAIFDNNLINSTVPGRRAGSSTYLLNCSAAEMMNLLADLDVVWDNCESTALVLHGRTVGPNIIIENLTGRQIIEVAKEHRFSERVRTAKDFARFNDAMENVSKHTLFAKAGQLSVSPPPVTVKPRLTAPAPTDADAGQQQEISTLTITVTGL